MENGDFRPPVAPPEPIELKFGMCVKHPTPQVKMVYAGLRVYGGGRGEVVTSRAFLLSVQCNSWHRTEYKIR